MFQVQNYVSDISEIPSQWIFEHYLKLSQPLFGQRVMIKSVFKTKDHNPSMSIYHNGMTGEYRFKDFSTGIGGSGYDLMSYLWNTNFRTTYAQILSDYRSFIQDGGQANSSELIPFHTAWKIASYERRAWNKSDVIFWSPFNIGSKMLEYYNVVPLSSFTIERTISTNLEQHQIIDRVMYGYFTNEGKLYKVYSPFNKKRKFYKIAGTKYIQGNDQIEGHENLIIASSLKDIMCVRTLSLKVDFLAPDSENNMFPIEIILELKKQFKRIATLLDSDATGIENMQKYYDKYAIPFIYYPDAKDPSDGMKEFGRKELLYHLVPTINHALEKYEILNPVDETAEMCY